MRKLFTLIFLLLLNSATFSKSLDNDLKNKVICVDPGHGGTADTDHYRVGKAGEREEWINLRVGLLLKKMLEDKGAKVVMTRTLDNIISLPDRAKIAMENKADLFVSIHHNATADSSVNFPIIYFHGNASENVASVDMGKLLASYLQKLMYKSKTNVSLVSDYTVFAESGASVLRNTYGIPAILAEASFFTNLEEEQKLKTEAHNIDEAKAYTMAIVEFFKKPVGKIALKNSIVAVIPPFQGLQEAERMNAVAKKWHQDFLAGKKLISEKDTVTLRQAYNLFTRSARSFPDSYVAAQCHEYRSEILKSLGKTAEAAQEAQRRKEYYVILK